MGQGLHDAGGSRATALRVVLACTFCHGELARERGAFCATCLAPHHADCFRGHGRCAVAGCAERRVVRPGRVPRLHAGWLAGLGAAVVVASVATHLSAARRAERAALEEVARADLARAGAEADLERARAEVAREEREASARDTTVEAQRAALTDALGRGATALFAATTLAHAGASSPTSELERELAALLQASPDEALDPAIERLGRLERALHDGVGGADAAIARVYAWLACSTTPRAVELHVLIREGCKAVRAMHAAIGRADWDAVDVGARALRQLMTQARSRGDEVLRRNADRIDHLGRRIAERARVLRCLAHPLLAPTAIEPTGQHPPFRCTIAGRTHHVGDVLHLEVPVRIRAIGPRSITLRCGLEEREVRLPDAP